MAISMFMHCRKCLAERPRHISAGEYARLAVGINEDGEIEIECVRHEELVGVLTKDGIVPDELRNSECAACKAGTPHDH